MTSQIYHGGDIAAARRCFGDPVGGWLDLSTGINPVPYPMDGLTSEDWTRLPSAEAQVQLEAIAAEAYGLVNPRQLLAVPGTQAMIQALPWLLEAKGKSVYIVGDTYREHAAVWSAHGAHVNTIHALNTLVGADVVVIVNPNNPDGRLFGRDDVENVAFKSLYRDAILVLDEAFMDVLGQEDSLLPILPRHGAIVLRSVGKTWGLAGMRLGFVAGPEAFIQRARSFFGLWAVSGPALKIGARALADKDWLEATRARLASDCAALDGILSNAGLDVIGGTPLFRLARTPNAIAMFEQLGRAGILVRPFPDRPGLIRFGIPASDADRLRLREALRP